MMMISGLSKNDVFQRAAKALAAAAALAALCGCSADEAAHCRADAPGFLIDNVRLIDGSGSPAYAADVYVSNGNIAAVGSLAACAGQPLVDGAGMTLAPGFIDTHSHADGDIFEVPDALAAVSQGITTVIVGQDGGSPFPLGD
ncbi:MAG: hypothetical protein OEZ09_16790, partial [Betaproteobacteria bacterium]|nr:hypothetical protein [Betaproteobacteria bacterium]